VINARSGERFKLVGVVGYVSEKQFRQIVRVSKELFIDLREFFFRHQAERPLRLR
jgi:hypothetical protein